MTENFYTIYTPDRRTYGGELTAFDFEGHHTLGTMATKIIKAETISIDQNGLFMWLDASDKENGNNSTELTNRVGSEVLTLNNFKFDGTDGWTGKTLKFTKSAANYATIPLPSSLMKLVPFAVVTGANFTFVSTPL